MLFFYKLIPPPSHFGRLFSEVFFPLRTISNLRPTCLSPLFLFCRVAPTFLFNFSLMLCSVVVLFAFNLSLPSNGHYPRHWPPQLSFCRQERPRTIPPHPDDVPLPRLGSPCLATPPLHRRHRNTPPHSRRILSCRGLAEFIFCLFWVLLKLRPPYLPVALCLLFFLTPQR